MLGPQMHDVRFGESHPQSLESYGGAPGLAPSSVLPSLLLLQVPTPQVLLEASRNYVSSCICKWDIGIQVNSV